jgi:hypothetical protein
MELSQEDWFRPATSAANWPMLGKRWKQERRLRTPVLPGPLRMTQEPAPIPRMPELPNPSRAWPQFTKVTID